MTPPCRVTQRNSLTPSLKPYSAGNTALIAAQIIIISALNLYLVPKL